MSTAYEPEIRRPRLPVGLTAPFSARTWREFAYLLLNLPIAIIIFTYAVAMLSLSAGLLITFLGIPLLAATLAGLRALGGVERARARSLLRLDVPSPEPVRVPGGRGGMLGWAGALFRSGTSWRHVLYAVVHLPWAVFSFTVSLTFMVYAWVLTTYPLWQWTFPVYVGQDGMQVYGDGEGRGWYLHTPIDLALAVVLGLIMLAASPWVIRGLAYVDRAMVTGLLGASKLATRVWELESDRGVVVDTAAADLRRIERDLHDGAQARLVALAMDLGLAKEKLTEDPQAAAKMVDEAHGEVKQALQELRDLARGIHPAILTDRGLDPAMSSLASRCTVPVRVTVDLPHRPAAAIEGIAYFTVSELLQNISKHSGAKTAWVDMWRAADRLLIQVRDDGDGGAALDTGSGLAGLAERLDSVDGLFVLESPVGGPTTITAELPWRE